MARTKHHPQRHADSRHSTQQQSHKKHKQRHHKPHHKSHSDTATSAIHRLSIDEALKTLCSSRAGLSKDESGKRLQEFGANVVERIERESLVIRFLREFTHLFALVLWLAAGLSFYAEWKEPGGGMATLGFAIIGVIVINGAFSFWQEYRAEQAINALEKLLPHRVKVLRDNITTEEDAPNLVPGDVILLEEGDSIPADCRVIESVALRVNNATMTGESQAKARSAEPDNKEDNILEAHNMLLAGTSVVSGHGKALVISTGTHTEFGKIARLTQVSESGISPLQQEINLVTRIVSLLAFGIGIVFFFIGQAIGLPFWANFIFAIGIIVANVPEGLLPTVTLALAMGAQRMARRNALIRHLPAVEVLGSANVICSDKTGTLTEGRMTVKKIAVFREPITENVAQLIQEANTETLQSLRTSHKALMQCALHCHTLKANSKQGEAQEQAFIGDSMEIALVGMARKSLDDVDNPLLPVIDEVPFDTERKRMSTLHQIDGSLRLYTKGAMECVLPLCEQILTFEGIQTLTEQDRENIAAAQNALAEEGLRVLALAYRDVPSGYKYSDLETHLVFAGLVGLEDPPRETVKSAVAQCHSAGIRVIMITGDHPATAKAIAQEIGIVRTVTPMIITGDELKHLSVTQLQVALGAEDIIFARMGADQKMRVVEALQRKGNIVAVTGDGVNDAPALKRADIGIAMGLSGTDVAREAADMVLLDDNFATIVAAIEEGRTIFANIRKFMTYILSSNVPEIIPYLAFVLFRLPLPLTIIQVLAVDLGTDMFPALALGAERPEHDVMHIPPRQRDEHIMNIPLLLRSYLFLGGIEAVIGMGAYFFVMHSGAWQYGQSLAENTLLYKQATTACLTGIVIAQMMNVFLCRSSRLSVFSSGFFSNRLLWYALAIEFALILAIDYTSIGNAVFGTAPIGLDVWLYCLPLALGMLALEELRKLVVRRVM